MIEWRAYQQDLRFVVHAIHLTAPLAGCFTAHHTPTRALTGPPGHVQSPCSAFARRSVEGSYPVMWGHRKRLHLNISQSSLKAITDESVETSIKLKRAGINPARTTAFSTNLGLMENRIMELIGVGIYPVP
jgi:hypothetical protein